MTTIRRRDKSNSRKSRKRRPIMGGSGKYANVFLIDVDVNSKSPSFAAKPCYPKDKKENNHNEPCYDPEWIYTPAGKKSNKVQCTTEKQRHDKMMKEDNLLLDAIEKTVDAIVKKGGKEGDLVENVAESGNATVGVYILKMKKNKLVISSLDYDYDPYGHVGSDFTVGSEFPIGYWSFAFHKGKHISVTGENLVSKAHWHNGTAQAEPIDKKTVNSIKQNQIKNTQNANEVDVTFPWGVLRFPFATLKEIKKVTYYKNNRVYFEPLDGKDKDVAIMYGWE